MPRRSKDPQRKRLYAVENTYFAGHTQHKLNGKQMRRWVREICKEYGVPVPVVRIGRCEENRVAQYDPEDDGAITLDKAQGCNGLSVMHEMAHHICTLNHPRAADHGPAFCRIYGELLDRVRLVPFAGWIAVCAQHGVGVLRYLPETRR